MKKSRENGPAEILTAPAETPARLSLLLHRVNFELQDQLERALEPLGIKVPHYAVLSVLAAGQRASQIDVGGQIRCDRNKMVVLVDELEARGLARRQANPADRRAKTVSLTDAGRVALHKALMLEQEVEARVLAPLKPAQREAFHELLRTLAETSFKS